MRRAHPRRTDFYLPARFERARNCWHVSRNSIHNAEYAGACARVRVGGVCLTRHGLSAQSACSTSEASWPGRMYSSSV